MKRLKDLWDKMHPEYNFLSDKNLRVQASRVHKNNVVMVSEYCETSPPINESDNHCIVTDNGNNYGNIIPNENIVPREAIAENIPRNLTHSGHTNSAKKTIFKRIMTIQKHVHLNMN